MWPKGHARSTYLLPETRITRLQSQGSEKPDTQAPVTFHTGSPSLVEPFCLHKPRHVPTGLPRKHLGNHASDSVPKAWMRRALIRVTEWQHRYQAPGIRPPAHVASCGTPDHPGVGNTAWPSGPLGGSQALRPYGAWG